MKTYTNLNDTYAASLRHALRQLRGAQTSLGKAVGQFGYSAHADEARRALARAVALTIGAVDGTDAARPARKQRAAA